MEDDILASLLDPEQLKRAEGRAMSSGLLNLGLGLLQGSQGQRGRPSTLSVLGQAGPGAVQAYQGSFDQTLRDIMLTQQMQDAQAKRAQQAAQQTAIESYITGLPLEEQARFRAFPIEAAGAMFREQPEQFVQLTPEQATERGLPTDKIFQASSKTGKISQVGGGGTIVNVGGGRVGTIPPGFELVEDRDGSLSMRQIPGGPEEQKEQKTQQEQQARADTVIRAGQTLIRDTTTAINTINKSGRGAAGVGSMLSFLPESAAAELQRDIDSIKGNIAIDSLLKIKESGAGLGAIPQAQLEALAGLLGSLDTRMTPNKLKSNLQDIQNLYKDIVEKEGGDPFKLAAQKGWSPETNRDDSFQSLQEAARRERQRRQGGR